MIGEFSYGFDEDPGYGGGGGIGSQVGSQTGEGGAGVGVPPVDRFVGPEPEGPVNHPQETPVEAAPYYGPFAPGVVPGKGEGDAQHNPNFAGDTPDYGNLVRAEYVSKFGRPPTDAELSSEMENLNKYGWDSGPYGGVKAQIDKRATNTPNEGMATLQSTASRLSTASNPQQQAVLRDQLSRQITQTLESQGHKVEFKDDGTMMVDGRPYQISGGDVAGMNSWMPTGTSTYRPGEIGFGDIPDFSFESLMSQLATPEVDAAMRDLLADPESLNSTVVGQMKAASKDELAGQQQMQEEDLRTMGNSYGFSESPWLASQMLTSRQGRDNAIIASNRNIDIEAAKTNAADRRAVAQLGLGWSGQKQQATMAAVGATLDRATAIGGRLALRESVNQEAARLGLSAQTLMAQHIQAKLGNLMTKYGIDVGADIDYKKLEQADKQHLEDLSMKMKELDEMIASRSQQDRQFRADLDLRTKKEQHDADVQDRIVDKTE